MEKRTLFTLYFTIIAAILGLSIISPVLPTIAKDLRATGFWMGMIFSGYAISRALLCQLWVDYQINMEERFSSHQGWCFLQ